MGKKEHKEFIEKLLAFLEAGFQNPIQIINYLQSRNKCKNPKCEAKTCKPLIPYFKGKKGKRPWNRDTLNKFNELRQDWYKPGQPSYEEPINGFFTLPRIAQFLDEEMQFTENDISKIFQIEWKQGPNCLWKGNEPVKVFNDKRIGMCCDFYLKDYMNKLPNIVGEIKVAALQKGNIGNIWNKFKDDISKCVEWLEPDISPHIKSRFKINRFEYALAILIDLTGGETYSNLWTREMKRMEALYLKERIFVRLIHVR